MQTGKWNPFSDKSCQLIYIFIDVSTTTKFPLASVNQAGCSNLGHEIQEKNTWKYAARGERRKSFRVSHERAVKAQRLNVSTLQSEPRTQGRPTASCVQQPPLRTAAGSGSNPLCSPSITAAAARQSRVKEKKKKKKHRQQGTNEEWKTSPNCKVWRRQGEKINNFSKGGLQWRTHVEARKCGLLALNVA